MMVLKDDTVESRTPFGDKTAFKGTVCSQDKIRMQSRKTYILWRMRTPSKLISPIRHRRSNQV
jgi:hypothetical protein